MKKAKQFHTRSIGLSNIVSFIMGEYTEKCDNNFIYTKKFQTKEIAEKLKMKPTIVRSVLQRMYFCGFAENISDQLKGKSAYCKLKIRKPISIEQINIYRF